MQVDNIVEAIENPNIKLKQPNKCGFNSCKEPLTITSLTCQFCNLRFCLKHRLPEVHSQSCADLNKDKLKKNDLKDFNLLKSMNDKDSKILKEQGSISSKLEKERKAIKDTLKSKIKEAEQKRKKK